MQVFEDQVKWNYFVHFCIYIYIYLFFDCIASQQSHRAYIIINGTQKEDCIHMWKIAVNPCS